MRGPPPDSRLPERREDASVNDDAAMVTVTIMFGFAGLIAGLFAIFAETAGLFYVLLAVAPPLALLIVYELDSDDESRGDLEEGTTL